MLPAPSQRWAPLRMTCPPLNCCPAGQRAKLSPAGTATPSKLAAAPAANACGGLPASWPPARLLHPPQPCAATSRMVAVPSLATTPLLAGSPAYEGNAESLVAAVRARRVRAGNDIRCGSQTSSKTCSHFSWHGICTVCCKAGRESAARPCNISAFALLGSLSNAAQVPRSAYSLGKKSWLSYNIHNAGAFPT